ncbi:MAG: nuclear transport factor 2 family protein [Cyclobacteriaceae bacterium]
MLKRSLFLLVIITLIACTKNDSTAQREKLEEALRVFNTAFETVDIATLDQMITNNYVHTNGSWEAFGKETWLGYMKNRKAKLESGDLLVSKYEMTDLNIKMHEKSAFVVARFITAGREDTTFFNKQIRVSNLWVIEDGEWKRAGFHDTMIENPAP